MVGFEVGILSRVSQPIALCSDTGTRRLHDSVRIPVVSKFKTLLRPVSVDVCITRHDFSRLSAKCVLHDKVEEARPIGGWYLTSNVWIFRRQAKAIMVRASSDRVIRSPLLVYPKVGRVLFWTYHSPEGAGDFGSADGQRILDGFLTRVNVIWFSRDPHTLSAVATAPSGFCLVGRRVRFEVVREDHRRIARDVLVAGVRRSDSDISWRCCWRCARSEKCDYSRKRHELGTSDSCEPHDALVQLKARHTTSQQTPMWRFYFPPGERNSGLADYSSTPAFVTQPRRCSAGPGPS